MPRTPRRKRPNETALEAGVEVPPNREDISRALDEAGLTSCKSMKRGIRKQVRKGGGGGGSRAGGKVCNSHMQDIDDGLD